MRAQKVLLVSMPVGALERQALGISLLKAILAESEIHCDIRIFKSFSAEPIGRARWEGNCINSLLRGLYARGRRIREGLTEQPGKEYT